MKDNKLVKAIVNLDLMVAMASLVGLIAVTFAGVIMRYIANRPIVWQEEVQLALVVWMIFIGGAATFRMKSHVAIDIVVDLFPALVQKIIRVAVFLVVLYVLYFMGVNGLGMVRQFIASSRYTNMLKLPAALIYAAVPVGCGLMMLNAAYEFASGMFGGGKHEGGEGGKC